MGGMYFVVFCEGFVIMICNFFKKDYDVVDICQLIVVVVFVCVMELVFELQMKMKFGFNDIGFGGLLICFFISNFF